MLVCLFAGWWCVIFVVVALLLRSVRFAFAFFFLLIVCRFFRLDLLLLNSIHHVCGFLRLRVFGFAVSLPLHSLTHSHPFTQCVCVCIRRFGVCSSVVSLNYLFLSLTYALGTSPLTVLGRLVCILPVADGLFVWAISSHSVSQCKIDFWLIHSCVYTF